MISTEKNLEDLTLTIKQEIHVLAPLDTTFDALLEQLGPGNETPDGKSLNMRIEAWPGGRWYRDLGEGNGHFWANVQAIKRPTLLEFAGPLFASFPMVSNVQYRLSEVEGGTAIWATAMGISGPMSRPSSGPRCLSLLARCSRRSRWSRTCNTG